MENELCIFCEKEPITNEAYQMGDACFLKLKQVRKRTPGPVKFYKANRTRSTLYSLPKFYKKDLKTRMIEKHGQELIDDILTMETKPLWPLAFVAKKYGLSRERIRQIYVGITGKKWKNVKKLRDLHVRDEMGCARDPRQKIYTMNAPESLVGKGTITEVAFIKECLKRGYEVSCPAMRTCDTVINGFNVEVKLGGSLYKASKRNKISYVHCGHLSENEFKSADFVAAYNKPIDKWFIIPIKSVPNGGNIFISDKPSNYYNAKNRYHEFKEAWHLIEKRQ